MGHNKEERGPSPLGLIFQCCVSQMTGVELQDLLFALLGFGFALVQFFSVLLVFSLELCNLFFIFTEIHS